MREGERVSDELPQRPILRYHGGKWMLAPWIISHFPPHRVYVEPFGGAASVLLQKPRSPGEVYNDLDGEVVNLFRVVRERSAKLTRALIWTPFSREGYREAFMETEDIVERARRMVIRSFMGHGSNAINRALKSGFRATGYRSGKTHAADWSTHPPTLRAVAARLRGVIIENRAASEVIEQQDSSETLFYCDPPYVHETRALDTMHGNHFYAHELSDADHEALAAQLCAVRGMVILSGYRSDLYARLYPGWNSVERQCALSDSATPRVEVLWFNAAAWRRRQTTATLFDAVPL